MLEFERVDHAPTKPFTCVCGTHVGPFVRTFFERWGEEVYLCESCAGRAAKCLGMVKGPELTKLRRAATVLREKEKELADVLEREAGIGVELAAERARVQALEAELATERGKVTQFEHLLGGVRERLDDPTLPIVTTGGHVPEPIKAAAPTTGAAA